MGLRKDFLVHKKKTVESFGLVRADISSINSHLDSLRSAVYSVQGKIAGMENEVSSLRQSVNRNTSEIAMQHSHNSSIQSKIEGITKSVSSLVASVNSFRDGTSRLIAGNQRASKELLSNKQSIKKLFSLLKAESNKNRQLNSALKKIQIDARRMKKLKIGKAPRMAGKRAKKIARKTIKKTITPRKIVTETITPKKRKIVEVFKTKKPLI